ncbi:hypothetical protein BC829DRAFT_63705 [Chytridium lagenaria]|nr:hypothetical protein BC829DRAFT_63705 [Chytridium lagenaria]
MDGVLLVLKKLITLTDKLDLRPVHTALSAGHYDVATYLLDYISDIDVSDYWVGSCVAMGTEEFVKKLVKSGRLPSEISGKVVMDSIEQSYGLRKDVNVNAMMFIISNYPMTVCDIDEGGSSKCCLIEAERVKQFTLIEAFLDHPSFTHGCKHFSKAFESAVFNLNAKNTPVFSTTPTMPHYDFPRRHGFGEVE